MRVCPNCQATVSDTANFCDTCGRSFRTPPAPEPAPGAQPAPGGLADAGVCSACGYRNVPGEMFCQNCGVQLAPVASVPPPPPRPLSGPLPQPAGICPECGATITTQDMFCPNCGVQLQPGGDASVNAPASAHAAPEMPAAPPAGLPEAHLIVKESGMRLSLPAQRSEIILGRSDPVRAIYPDVDLTPAGGDTHGVSRRHARMIFQDGQYHVEDLNSTNFTFLNRQRLQPGQLYPLHDGDELRVGLLALQVSIH